MAVIIDGTNGITTPPTLTLQAGTTTAAPLLFTAGSLLTTPVAGTHGYDGKVFYGTPIGTQRGVMPTAQFFRLDSGLAGANVNTAQNVFGVGVTLSSSTVYEFEAVYLFNKTIGSGVSHTINLGFAGTATLNTILYYGHSGAVATATFPPANNTNIFLGFVQTAASTISSPAFTGATVTYGVHLRGVVSVNAGGTFIPQYTLSAAPGGAYTTAANSYMLIYPIGASGANTSVGTWA